jgi:hypothetical protein
MKGLEKENILEFKVENFVYLMTKEEETFQSLKHKVHNLSLPEEDNAKVIKRIEYANARVLKPLSNSEIFLFIFIPFGIVTRLARNRLFDMEKEIKLGYKTRIKEYYLYSKLGLATYLVIIILFAIS